MTDVIGSVGLLVKPITTKFAAETQEQVRRALDGVTLEAPPANWDQVEGSADKVKESLSNSFADLDITTPEANWSKTEKSASTTAAKIEQDFNSLQIDAPETNWNNFERSAKSARDNVVASFKGLKIVGPGGDWTDTEKGAKDSATNITTTFDEIEIHTPVPNWDGLVKSATTASDQVADSFRDIQVDPKTDWTRTERGAADAAQNVGRTFNGVEIAPKADWEGIEKSAERTKTTLTDTFKGLEVDVPEADWDKVEVSAERAKNNILESFGEMKVQGPKADWTATEEGAETAASNIKDSFEGLTIDAPKVDWDNAEKSAKQVREIVESSFNKMDLEAPRGDWTRTERGATNAASNIKRTFDKIEVDSPSTNWNELEESAEHTRNTVINIFNGMEVDSPRANWKPLEDSAKKTKLTIIQSFDDASKESNRSLGGIGGPGTFDAAERSAAVAAANIRRNIEKAAFESDLSLNRVGGRGGGGSAGGGGRRPPQVPSGPGSLEPLIAGVAGLAAGLQILKFPVMVEGATAALGAISSLTAGVLALAGALGTLSGAAIAIPGIYGALGQAFGVVKLASGGVAEALKAHGQEQAKTASTAAKAAKDAVTNAAAQRAAAERVIDATQSLARAQQTLENSQKTLIRAQEALNNSYHAAAEAIEDAQFASASAIIGEERARLSIARTELAQQRLNDARKDAIEQLEDLKLAMEGSALGEQRARIRLEEALKREAELREESARTGIVSASDLASASLAVKEAELAIKEILEGRGDQQIRLTELQEIAAGKDKESALASQESALAIQEAQLGLLQAIDRRLDTQKTLGELEEKGITRSDIVTRAQDALASAQQGVANATDGVADAQRNLALALETAADAAKKMGKDGTEAVDTFKDAMDKLGPNAKAFVNKITEMKDRFKELRNIAAENLFPGVVAGLDAVTPLFKDLEPVVAGTARVLGNLAKRAGELVGSPAFRKDLVNLGKGNAVVINNLGEAVLSLVEAFKDIMVVGQPLVIFMSALGRNFASSLRDTVATARESGGLASFFEKTKSTLLDVIDIVGNIFGTLKSIFAAGFPEGAQYLFDLRVVFENIRGIVNGAVESGALKDWFENARPSIEAIAGIFSDLLSGLIKIGAEVGPKLEPVFQKIREELVPAVLKIIQSVNVDFLNALIGITTQVATLVSTFLQANPVLTTLLNLIELILGAVNFLGTELGPVSTAFTGILSALALIGTINAAFKLTRIISEFAGLRKGIEVVSGLIPALRTNLLLLSGTGSLGNLLSVLGPIAAALGTLTAVVVTGALVWNDYKQGVDKAKKSFDEIKGAIETNNVESLTKAWQDAEAKTVEAIGGVEKYGGSLLNSIRGSVTGVTDALGITNEKVYENLGLAKEGVKTLDGFRVAYDNLTGNLSALGRQYGLTNKEVIDLANAHKIDLSQGFDAVKGPMGEALQKTRDSVLASQDLSGEFEVLSSEASTAEQKLGAYRDALDKTLGTTLSLFDADTRLAASLDDLAEKYKVAGGNADITTKAGRDLRDALSDTTTAMGDKIQKMIEEGASTADVEARTKEYIAKLAELQGKYPGLKTEIQGFINKLGEVPSGKGVDITVDASAAYAELNKLRTELEMPLITYSVGGNFNNRVAARGLILNEPTMVLAGEAGKEVILPLTDAKRTLELSLESGLFGVLAKAMDGGGGTQSSATLPRSFTPPPTTGPSGVVFGPGSVVVQFSGSVTPDEARMVGQQLGRGIEDVMASQEALVEAKAY